MSSNALLEFTVCDIAFQSSKIAIIRIPATVTQTDIQYRKANATIGCDFKRQFYVL